jgi:hypothetical protein
MIPVNPVHGAASKYALIVDHDLCIRMNDNGMTWLNASVAGAQAIQTSPVTCHSVIHVSRIQFNNPHTRV